MVIIANTRIALTETLCLKNQQASTTEILLCSLRQATLFAFLINKILNGLYEFTSKHTSTPHGAAGSFRAPQNSLLSTPILDSNFLLSVVTLSEM